MGLSKYEQEVIINFNGEEQRANLYTANPTWIRKMDKLVKENPNEFKHIGTEKLQGKIVSKAYQFPKAYITVRSKKRTINMTDEQRQAASERMRAARAQ